MTVIAQNAEAKNISLYTSYFLFIFVSEVYLASLHFLNILPICYILGFFFFSLSYYTAYNSPLILNFPGPMSGHLLVLLLDALYNSGAK